jgi:hypothetical protein
MGLGTDASPHPEWRSVVGCGLSHCNERTGDNRPCPLQPDGRDEFAKMFCTIPHNAVDMWNMMSYTATTVGRQVAAADPHGACTRWLPIRALAHAPRIVRLGMDRSPPFYQAGQAGLALTSRKTLPGYGWLRVVAWRRAHRASFPSRGASLVWTGNIGKSRSSYRFIAALSESLTSVCAASSWRPQ